MKPVKNEKAIGSLYLTRLKEAIKVIMSGEQRLQTAKQNCRQGGGREKQRQQVSRLGK